MGSSRDNAKNTSPVDFPNFGAAGLPGFHTHPSALGWISQITSQTHSAGVKGFCPYAKYLASILALVVDPPKQALPAGNENT
jgi:hypothetical protein